MSTFDKVIISSEEEKRYLRKIGLNEKKLSNIPIAVNEVFFTSSSSIPNVRQKLCFICW